MAQQSAEVTHFVTGSTSNKNSSSKSVPAYMRRRVNIPGPNLGFPVVLSYGPKTLTATTAGQMSIAVPGGLRPIAFGWFCQTAAPTGTMFLTRTVTATASGASPGMLLAAINLAVNPFGIMYSRASQTPGELSLGTADVTSTTYYITSTGDKIGSIGPEMNPTGVSSPRIFTNLSLSGTINAVDFHMYLLCVPTRHSNTLSASD